MNNSRKSSITFRLPVELKNRLKAKARRDNRSISAVICLHLDKKLRLGNSPISRSGRRTTKKGGAKA